MAAAAVISAVEGFVIVAEHLVSEDWTETVRAVYRVFGVLYHEFLLKVKADQEGVRVFLPVTI